MGELVDFKSRRVLSTSRVQSMELDDYADEAEVEVGFCQVCGLPEVLPDGKLCRDCRELTALNGSIAMAVQRHIGNGVMSDEGVME